MAFLLESHNRNKTRLKPMLPENPNENLTRVTSQRHAHIAATSPAHDSRQINNH